MALTVNRTNSTSASGMIHLANTFDAPWQHGLSIEGVSNAAPGSETGFCYILAWVRATGSSATSQDWLAAARAGTGSWTLMGVGNGTNSGPDGSSDYFYSVALDSAGSESTYSWAHESDSAGGPVEDSGWIAVMMGWDGTTTGIITYSTGAPAADTGNVINSGSSWVTFTGNYTPDQDIVGFAIGHGGSYDARNPIGGDDDVDNYVGEVACWINCPEMDYNDINRLIGTGGNNGVNPMSVGSHRPYLAVYAPLRTNTQNLGYASGTFTGFDGELPTLTAIDDNPPVDQYIDYTHTQYFIDDSAVGNNDGSSWIDAWDSYESGINANLDPGDVIKIAVTHDETGSTWPDWDFSAGSYERPIKVLCIDPTTENLATGARLTINNAAEHTVLGYVYMYGLEIDWNIASSYGGGDITGFTSFEQCVIHGNGMSFEGISNKHNLRDSEIGVDATTPIALEGSSTEFINCTVTGINTDAFSARSARQRILACQISDMNIVRADQNAPLEVIVSMSSYDEGQSLTGASIGMEPRPEIHFDYVDTGESATATVAHEYHTPRGWCYTDIDRYREGGANDGSQANPHSFRLHTENGLSVTRYAPLTTEWFHAWTTGNGSTSYTYTMRFAHDGTGNGTAGAIQDDQFWIEFIGPNDQTGNSLGYYTGTASDPLATPADIATDSSSTWVGTQVGTQQEVTVTYTPDRSGPVRMRVNFCNTAGQDITEIALDPKIIIAEA